MNLVKYKNRKLYSYDEKRYVNLDEVYELILNGVDVTVEDYHNGKDITSKTICEILPKLRLNKETLVNIIINGCSN